MEWKDILGNDNNQVQPNSESPIKGELKDLPFVPKNQVFNLDVIMRSNIVGDTPEARTRSMQALFNSDRPLQTIESRLIGNRVEPGLIKLVHINNIPEMITSFDGPRQFEFIKGLDIREEIGIFPESKLFYGAKGVFVINVPQGKFARAWIGTEPMLLDQGTHVIHSHNLKDVTEDSLVDQSNLYINHGNIHIVRVPPGNIAKITLNNDPYILDSRKEAYVFKNPLFNFDQANGFMDAGSSYIRNGSLHILQVPKGKIATVWVGAKPVLLYFRPEPYIVLDNLFRLEPKTKEGNHDARDLFYDANEEIICHGSIKRIIPPTGHVAVTYENGRLEVIKPSNDGQPILLDSESRKVTNMFNVQKQTLRFPSEKIKRERERENSEDKNAINYEIFTTANGARYGVKLLVVFSIADPQLALTQFKPDDIVPHIENLVVTEMNKAIQATESTNYLQAKARTSVMDVPINDPLIASAPPFYGNAQDEIKDHLSRDLRAVGIEVDRVSIEESIPIDQEVIEQMAKFAVRNKQITLEVALLERERQIREQHAQQAAMQSTILFRNQNMMLVERAAAEREAAKIQAETQAILMQSHATNMRIFGQALDQSPALLKLHLAQAVYGQESFVPTMLKQPVQVMPQNMIAAANPSAFFSQSVFPNPSDLVDLKSDDQLFDSGVKKEVRKE